VLLAGTCTGFGRTVCGSPIGWVKASRRRLAGDWSWLG
jgi:hypothetical protein